MGQGNIDCRHLSNTSREASHPECLSSGSNAKGRDDASLVASRKGMPVSPKLRIMVIGAVNVDICAKPFRPLVGADSNPGRVTVSMGGVGRNIAHNLRLLGQPVSLITVFGDDSNGERIRRDLEHLGIDISSSFTEAHRATSSYVFITDEKGEMQLAISDMAICERMTPQIMEERLDVMNQSCLCVIDANLPADTIHFLAEHVTVPLFADPVSTAKLHKLQPVLSHLHTLKPNRLEAEMLTGVRIRDEASLHEAAAFLLHTGVQRVFITLGDKGVLCADQEQQQLLPPLVADVKSTTGGGDCFLAALAYAYRMGFSLEESGSLALAAGAICAEGEQTINEQLSARLVHTRAGVHMPE
ncbi:MAG: carbohydrate kinase family protein [Lachnospiraceae bacterium]|nr:carbohydrate kinase family protein [Lachnospiraceae bacterium]